MEKLIKIFFYNRINKVIKNHKTNKCIYFCTYYKSNEQKSF